jgi:hypothetical protein
MKRKPSKIDTAMTEIPFLTRKKYLQPTIVKIELDNEISLALQSEPPALPGESLLKAPDYFNNDPYKINIG